MRSHLLVCAFLLGACGGTIDAAPDAGGPTGAPTAEAGPSPTCAADLAGVAPQTLPFGGFVVAETSDPPAASRPSAYAAFRVGAEGPWPTTVTSPSCTCARNGFVDPNESVSAGVITLQAPHCSATLATLPFQEPNPYGTTTALAWTPGDALGVSATGAASGTPDGIAPFAGILQTGRPFVGLSPAIGPTAQPPVISLGADFVVTWTPEGSSEESVTLYLSQSRSDGPDVSCTCTAPDSAGKLTMSAADLAAFFQPTTSPSNAGDINLSRSIVRTVAAGASAVQLVGVVSTAGAASFR